ncbi:MAG: flavoprotein [Mycoplasmatales bacterium]
MRILIGITGSNAVLKTSYVIKKLISLNHEIICISTKNSEEFGIKNEFKAIDKLSYYEHSYKEKINLDNIDVVAIIPASYNFIGKFSHGICDDLLLKSLFYIDSKFILCPAMNSVMWENKILQENIMSLKDRSITIINPRVGLLTSGKKAIGVLEKEDDIIKIINNINLN